MTTTARVEWGRVFRGTLTARRPFLMWIAARSPILAAAAIYTRAAVLYAAAWPITAAATIGVLATRGLSIGAVAFLNAVWIVDAFAALFTPDGYGLWRKTWSARRHWPIKYVIVDSTTADVQASFGGAISGFLASARHLTRPIFRHPPLGWRPRFGPGRCVTWRCGPPPGTTLPRFAVAAPATAANYQSPEIVRMDVGWVREEDSWGTLTWWFDQPPDELEGIDPDELEADWETAA